MFQELQALLKNGFIRKVIGIENKGDNCVIKTEPAVLTDVFEKSPNI